MLIEKFDKIIDTDDIIEGILYHLDRGRLIVPNNVASSSMSGNV